MKTIAFIDTEVEPNNRKILDIGSVKGDGSSFHSNSIADFVNFLDGAEYVCGHNILNHDLKYIQDTLNAAGINNSNIIDTLFLSPLLFPARPYHALLKDDKLQTEDLNNPLNDSIKARDIFFDEVTAFKQVDSFLKNIYYSLLKDTKEFGSFFHFFGYKGNSFDPEKTIRIKFPIQICERADLTKIISEYPIELAYSLALIKGESLITSSSCLMDITLERCKLYGSFMWP